MTTPTNPLMAKLRIPGETFRLPSQGLFYTNGELADGVERGEVEVYPMTAQDEIVLNTPDKLLSGRAILEVFAKCVPQVLKPADLLAKDVDFLMLCLRIVSFGPTMEIEYTHTCDHGESHDHVVALSAFVKSVRELDPTSLTREYQLTMENGQVVSLKPLSYGSILELYKVSAMTKTSDLSVEDAEVLVIDALVGVVRDVDGVSDSSNIREWVKSIPLGWKRRIEATAQSVSSWGVKMDASIVCPDCGETVVVPITTNPVSFFM